MGPGAIQAAPDARRHAESAGAGLWYPSKRGETRFTASIHPTLRDLNAYATHLLVYSKVEQPQQRLARLFVDGRRVRIRGVRILIEELGQAT